MLGTTVEKIQKQEQKKLAIKDTRMMQIMEGVSADDILHKIHTDLDKVNYLLKEANNHKSQLKRSIDTNQVILNDLPKNTYDKVGEKPKPPLQEVEKMVEFWSTVDDLLEAKMPVLSTARKVLKRESASFREHVQRSQEVIYSGQTTEQKRLLNSELARLIDNARLGLASEPEQVSTFVQSLSSTINSRKIRYLAEHLSERGLIAEGLSRGMADVTEELLDPVVILQETLSILELYSFLSLRYKDSWNSQAFLETASAHLVFLNDISFFAWWPFDTASEGVWFSGVDQCEVLTEIEQNPNLSSQTADLMRHQVYLHSIVPRCIEFCDDFLDPLDPVGCEEISKALRVIVDKVYKQNKTDENLRQVKKIMSVVEQSFQQVCVGLVAQIQQDQGQYLSWRQAQLHLLVESAFVFRWLIPHSAFLELLTTIVFGTLIDKLTYDTYDQTQQAVCSSLYRSVLTHCLIKSTSNLPELSQTFMTRNKLLMSRHLSSVGAEVLQQNK